MGTSEGTDNGVLDRAVGAVIAHACGDALGVPYEFMSPPKGEAVMRGGGLGGFAPGEWSDDTSMSLAVLLAVASGADLQTEEGLSRVANNFLTWAQGGPPDIGLQTRAVLAAASQARGPAAARCRQAAQRYGKTNPHSAGNGALMRTVPVALTFLNDRDAAAEAAIAVAALTHSDDLAAESCVLATEIVRLAVVSGKLDFYAGVDLVPGPRQAYWTTVVNQALDGPPSRFKPNGFTVAALQAAISAAAHTPVPASSPGQHLKLALQAAVHIGDDTDTVAAIAGGFLGAKWGASQIPPAWRSAIHGWPGGNSESIEAAVTAVIVPRLDRLGSHCD